MRAIYVYSRTTQRAGRPHRADAVTALLEYFDYTLNNIGVLDLVAAAKFMQ